MASENWLVGRDWKTRLSGCRRILKASWRSRAPCIVDAQFAAVKS